MINGEAVLIHPVRTYRHTYVFILVFGHAFAFFVVPSRLIIRTNERDRNTYLELFVTSPCRVGLKADRPTD